MGLTPLKQPRLPGRADNYMGGWNSLRSISQLRSSTRMVSISVTCTFHKYPVSKKLTTVTGQEITTAHASNAGSPTPVGGPIQPGIVPNGTTASFAVPTGWAGNVAMNRANMSITGDETLLEASFVA